MDEIQLLTRVDARLLVLCRITLCTYNLLRQYHTVPTAILSLVHTQWLARTYSDVRVVVSGRTACDTLMVATSHALDFLLYAAFIYIAMGASYAGTAVDVVLVGESISGRNYALTRLIDGGPSPLGTYA